MSLVGPAGTLLGAVYFTLGLIISGASIAPEMLPSGGRLVGQLLPPGAGASAIRTPPREGGQGSPLGPSDCSPSCPARPQASGSTGTREPCRRPMPAAARLASAVASANHG